MRDPQKAFRPQPHTPVGWVPRVTQVQFLFKVRASYTPSNGPWEVHETPSCRRIWRIPTTEKGKEPILDSIHVILKELHGNIFQAHLKAEAQRIPREEIQDKWFRRDEVITFSKGDTVPNQTPHLDILIIWIIATNTEIRRVYVDIGAPVSVMYLSCFKKRRIDSLELRPYVPL